MREPGGGPMPGIVPHRALFGRDAERVRNPPPRSLIVGREGDTDMAVVENRIMLAVSLLDLIQGLRDQESAHAVSGPEGEAGLEEIQATERRELVEHHRELVFAAMGDRKSGGEGKGG